MNLPRLRTLKKGFTLIELLTVIAIIGILSGLIGTAVIKARKIANMAAAGNNCGQIAKGYAIYSSGGSNPKSITQQNVADFGGGVTGWAVYLAGKGGPNNADLWFIRNDPKLDAVENFPQLVADVTTNPSRPTANPQFQQASPKSWAVVQNAAKNPQDPANYPIVWTRGLSGTTWLADSPWGAADGGHVGFLDGHTIGLKDTQGDTGTGAFLDQKTGRPTSDINEAIRATSNSTSAILEDKQ